jgi:hypothetical protein
MSVYVDDMRLPARVGHLRARWSHLTADTKEELHAFAARIGLRRSWFQDKPRGLWHYDVTDTKRRQAIVAGALPIRCSTADTFAHVWHRPGREGVTPTANRKDQPA